MHFVRLLMAVVVVSLPVFAQFTSIATTSDGSALYFVTSLRQKGSDQPEWGKIFVSNAAGLKPYLVLPMDPPVPRASPAITISNNYDLIGVDVSGDGQRIAAAGRSDCANGGGVCVYRESVAANVTGLSNAFPGTLRLSANGKWGLSIGSGPPPFGYYEVRRIDLATGAVVGDPWGANPPAWLPAAGRLIANDGTAVIGTGNQLILLRTTGPEVLPLIPGEEARSATISADASLVLFTASSGAASSLNLFDLTRREERVVWRGEHSNAMLSDDGRQILFLANDSAGTPQAYVLAANGGEPRALTANYAGIQAAVLSGDGTACYVVTKAGRIFWLSTTGSAFRQVVGRTPVAGTRQYFNGYISAPEWRVDRAFPGSLITVDGIGLAELRKVAETAPLPDTLAGVRVSYGGTALPLSRVAPDAVGVQLPWDLQGDTVHPSSLTVETDADDADFQTPPLRVYVRPAWVGSGFEPGANGETIAIHSAFDSLVSARSPARSGEIVHFYARGLGPVDPPVSIGYPGPANPPALLVAPLRCQAEYTYDHLLTTQSIDVIFAGLAPGLIGYYQVSLRMPTLTRTPDAGVNLSCLAGEPPSGGSGGSWGVVPVVP